MKRPLTIKALALSATDYGLMNVFLRPGVYQRHYKVLHNCLLSTVDGAVQRRGPVLHAQTEDAVGM